MFDRNRSGQALFFPLVSAISGNAVVGQAAGISGRVTLDGGSMAVVAGAIDEPGGGQYRLLPFAADTNGNSLGFYFTASGCVPVSFTVITQQNVSGRLVTASGVNAIVPSATLSGVVAASGLFANVPIATISGVIANSGLFVSVPIASISGTNTVVPIVTISGLNAVVPPVTLSGVFANIPIASISGTSVVATTASGSLYLASGSLFRETFASGVLAASGGIPTAWGNSGNTLPASGANVTVPSASLSGVVAASGIFVQVPIANLSGVTIASGGVVQVPIASFSGVIIQSGAFVTVPKATISGVVANSGLFTTVLTATISGVIPLSGQIYIASGTGSTAVVDSGSIAQIASTLLTISVSGSIESNAARQSLATVILKQTGRFNTLASGTASGIAAAVTYLCDGITPKIIQPVTTTRSGLPISELGIGG